MLNAVAKIHILIIAVFAVTGCIEEDDQVIEVCFITRNKGDIREMKLKGADHYELSVGVMPAPGNMKVHSMAPPPPPETSATLQWKDDQGNPQSRPVDLPALNIDPPGTVFVVLNHGDVETTFVKQRKLLPSEEEEKRIRALRAKFQGRE